MFGNLNQSESVGLRMENSDMDKLIACQRAPAHSLIPLMMAFDEHHKDVKICHDESK